MVVGLGTRAGRLTVLKVGERCHRPSAPHLLAVLAVTISLTDAVLA